MLAARKQPWRRWGALAALVICVAVGAYVWRSRDDPWGALADVDNQGPAKIHHPISGAVMPRNMPAPVVLWNTNVPGVGRWVAGFRVGRQQWRFDVVQPMWRVTESEWGRIKQAANGAPIELVVAGYPPGRRGAPRARNAVRFTVAAEAAEAPLFYREVNLPFKEAVKDPSHIRWRFGTLDQGTLPPIVLEKLPVCGNCHSFTKNGEYLAMDVDYANDKGSYVITRTGREMRMATSDIITWDDFKKGDGQLTLGLLSQISPDGRYVLSTVKDISIFMAKPDLAFSQLFFPFQGIIGVYDRQAKRFFSLPGADDPAFVQSNPVWSPDGKWVVFARNRAVKMDRARAQGRILLSGEEGEEFLRQTRNYQYDLYRIPFNDGQGGRAEPLRGASANGRSNFFPKYSPDGRWIVFCQAATYMLLQPDSALYLIPAAGGEARRMDCNLSRMNSWHSWSPDGRWLVFSSKAHSDYTQLYLARMHANGTADPPVWLAHMVEPGRAANIPEFVASGPDAIGKIQAQFLDDYSYVRAGDEFYRSGEVDNAIQRYRLALSLNPNNLRAHQQLGRLLDRARQREEVLEHLRTAVRLEPRDAVARFDLGRALTSEGDLSNAVVQLEEAVRWLPKGGDQPATAVDPKHSLPEALHLNLGIAYQRAGQPGEAEAHYEEALRLVPDYAEVHYNFGTLLLRSNRLAEAERHFADAVRLAPGLSEAHNCLGIVRQRQERRAEARACFQEAVRCDPNNWQAHLNLAYSYLAEGDRDRAVPELRETLRLRPSCEPARQALAKALGPTPPGSR